MLLLILFCQVLNCGYCQSNHLSSPKLSTQTKSTIQDPSSDSTLRAENQFYKLKEDYYSDALSDQASRFGSIVSAQSTVFSIVVGLLSLVLGVQLVSFRRKVDSDIAALRMQVRTVAEEAKEKNDYALYRIYRSYSETLLTQADSNISVIGSYTIGLWQCIQALETLALSYQYSQTDQYRSAVDRYVSRALSLADGAILSINLKVDDEDKPLEDGFVEVNFDLDHLSYGRTEFMTDFVTLFDKQTIHLFMTQLLRESHDARLLERLFTLQGKIYQTATKCGATIPDQPVVR